MEISKHLKQRFCKECGIPIALFDEPFFSERIGLFDPFYDTVKKYDNFVKNLAVYSNEQEYFEEYNRVKEDAINCIKSSAGYLKFNNEDMNLFKIPDQYKGITSKAIYHPDNVGKSFISVDMKKANFTVLKTYDSSIFEADTWEEFLGRFTENRHIIESKYIRQVILGNCNPSRHITYMKYIMCKEIDEIEKRNHLLSKDRIVQISSDEIVYNVSDMSFEEVSEIVSSISYSDILDYSGFKLLDVAGYAYIKQFVNGKRKIKCAETEFLPIIIRKLSGCDVHDTDLYFLFKGEIAHFKDVPERLKLYN